MALSAKDTYNLLREFNEYGATIYYLLEINKISIEDVTNVLFKSTIDQVTLVFPKFIEKIKVKDIDLAKKKYSQDFTKFNCIDRIIKKDNDKHQHLKEIRDVVYLEEKVDDMIMDKTYLTALNLNYTYKILDMIESNQNSPFISIKETIRLYRTALDNLIEENDKKISSNIDSYYISSITN